MPGHRLRPDSGVAGFRGVDEFVECDTVGTGQRQQKFEGGPALSRFEPGQGADGDAGLRGEVAEGGLPLEPELSKSRAHALQHVFVFHGIQYARLLC